MMNNLLSSTDSIANECDYISNHTGYDYVGGENYEHDTNASQVNYSGCEDDIYNAISVHDGWQEGFDY